MAKYIVQHRRGTVSQWAAKNTIIPKEGEIVIEIDEENSLHKLKIGDGIHTYAELAYLMAGDEVVTQVLSKALPRVVTVTLDVDQWSEITCESDPNLGYYGQVIALDNITEYSRLDLQPDADMLAEFQTLNLVFVTENKGGTITVYSVGDMPLKSYTMQATIVETEVVVDSEKVVGIPIGTPTTKADWTQTDESKADYIKNKPTILTEEDVIGLIAENGGSGGTINQIQSDWNQVDVTKVDYIKNKPDLIGKKTAEGGEIFNNYDLNRAGYFSHAEGNKNIAGLRGYYQMSNGLYSEADNMFKIELGNTVNSIQIGDVGYLAIIGHPVVEFTIATQISDSSFQINLVNEEDVETLKNFTDLTSFGVWNTNSDSYDMTIYGYIWFNKYDENNKQIGEYNIGAVSHSEGYNNLSLGEKSHTEGHETYVMLNHGHAEGTFTKVYMQDGHAEGRETEVHAPQGHAEGFQSKALDNAAHAEGEQSVAEGFASHAEGSNTKAQGGVTHAEGLRTTASGYGSHAEGVDTISEGTGGAHAEGSITSAKGDSSHAEGYYTIASGKCSHAEGSGCETEGNNSHAEGYKTMTVGTNSHAEGQYSQALADNSHAEGDHAIANGKASHASGYYVTTDRVAQTTVGRYNTPDTNAIFIVGNGTSENTRVNSLVVKTDGSAELQTMGTKDNSVATKKYVDDIVGDINSVLATIVSGGAE